MRLRPLTGVAIGVELGFQHTAVVARLAHQPFGDARVKVIDIGATQGQDVWLPNLVAAIHALVAQIGNGPDDIATIGMGIPRMVGPRDHILTPPALPPWREGENPVSMLTDRLTPSGGGTARRDLVVRLDNDANLGAMAESVYQHPHRETLIYVKASTGIGAGIVIGGKIVRGRAAAPGRSGTS